MNTWVNVLSLGVRGDGIADDTEPLRKAVGEHKTLYFPSGQYRVSDTITLKPDTILIGLHPSVTRILITDGTAAFQGVASPKALLQTPNAAPTILTAIDLSTNPFN